MPFESADYSLNADEELQSVAAGGVEQTTTSAKSASGTVRADSNAAVETPEFSSNAQTQESASQLEAPQSTSTPQPPSTPPAVHVPAPAPPTSLIPERFREAPEAKWYVRPPAGGQYGPAAMEDFEQWLREKRVTQDSLIWREGWPEWLTASKALPEVYGSQLEPQLAPELPSQPIASTAPALPNQPAAGPALGTSAPLNSAVSVNGSGTVLGPGLVSGQTTTGTAPGANLEKNRIERKRRKKRNYTLMIASLTVIAIVLITALIIVLMSQGN